MTDLTMFPGEEETAVTEEKTTVTPTAEATDAVPTDGVPTDGVPTDGDGKNKKVKDHKLKKENHDLKERVSALENALAESQDKYMRLAAEYDNFRKRTAKEKEGIFADAYGECITEILPVVDNLERALQYSEGDKVVEGVRMTMNQFSEILKKLGIEEIPTEIFDPMLHNAVMHEENEELGEGVITAVFQKGYKKGDRVIRYAMVKVAN